MDYGAGAPGLALVQALRGLFGLLIAHFSQYNDL